MQMNALKDSYDDMTFTPPYLSTITARTLIVHGDRDPLYPVNLAFEMYAAIPRSYLWVVPNGGHGPIFGDMAGFPRDLSGLPARRMGRHVIGPVMLYMVIEDFRDGDAVPSTAAFAIGAAWRRKVSRMSPVGSHLIFTRCYQVMECSDKSLLDAWMARWEDLVHFEVVPVVTSEEAAATIAPPL